ncbi:hypothetical protein M1N92_01600 [Dehalococcoidia bacterium]|nr:hypothetical protein [Dehalococcoidia bacterium]
MSSPGMICGPGIIKCLPARYRLQTHIVEIPIVLRVTIRHEFLNVCYYVEFSLRETAYSFSDYLDCYEVGEFASA